VHEVHALLVDVGGELRQGVQFALAGSPVEVVVPASNEFAQVIRIGAGPPRRGGPLRETGSRQPVCEIAQHGAWHVDGEGRWERRRGHEGSFVNCFDLILFDEGHHNGRRELGDASADVPECPDRERQRDPDPRRRPAHVR
jgi:hypothetical protein